MKYLTSTYLKDIEKYKISIFVKEKYCITVKKILKIKGPFVLKEENFKPEALKNSYVLKSNPKLKTIFDKYYNNNPKKFIDIIEKNKEKIMYNQIMIGVNK